eukprot:CAMPEP_0176505614 /NCGR_PEP_ID=MMETSP0200_2-20121128/16594_1 /TAXON_ID=947934 /ORGANISM="Chaetoceros sp., Strain GSL56" /LENGTH=675 /DNA_ID=CAMNT_0017905191 /DNA_START=290 /DNA_END=2320 /DNA_ORIENTATION=-
MMFYLDKGFDSCGPSEKTSDTEKALEYTEFNPGQDSDIMQAPKGENTKEKESSLCRCDSSFSSSLSGETVASDQVQMIHSFSEDNLRTFPGKYSPLKIGELRADYIPFFASHSEFVSFDVKDSSFLPHRSLRGETSKTIVIIPSMDLDATELKRMGSTAEFYEERQLYQLFLLVRDPSFKIIFLSSNPVDMVTTRYYLTLDGCSDSELKNRLSRLVLLNPKGDGNTNHSLSQKLNQNDKILRTIRNIVEKFSEGESPSCGLSFFCGSDSNDEISNKLKVRSLEANGRHLYFGSKQGSRQIFRKCGVPCAPGTPDIEDDDLLSTPQSGDSWSRNHRFICDPHNLAIGIARQIVLKNVKSSKWVVKLNQGFSGKGNACLNLEEILKKKYIDSNGLPLYGNDLVNAVAQDIEMEFPNMNFECKTSSWKRDATHAGYAEQIPRLGVIAEAFIEGSVVTSPSVQAVIDPKLVGEHRIEILSTHEQVLSGQVYTGCINPASEPYRSQIVKYTKKIGEALAEESIVGHFSSDFIAVKKCINGIDQWTIKAIELNLRQGGTTHPYSTMAILCGGHTDFDGVFRTKEGRQRSYVATDNYIDHRLKGLKSKDFLREFSSTSDPSIRKLRWSEDTKTGVIFHLLPFLEYGKIGFTAIGETPEEADLLFKRVSDMLIDIAEKRSHSS